MGHILFKYLLIIDIEEEQGLGEGGRFTEKITYLHDGWLLGLSLPAHRGEVYISNKARNWRIFFLIFLPLERYF